MILFSNKWILWVHAWSWSIHSSDSWSSGLNSMLVSTVGDILGSSSLIKYIVSVLGLGWVVSGRM